MKIEDFDLFATLVKQRSGLMLTKDKAYLLESRLMPVARKWNCKTLDDLAQALRTKRDEPMIFDIVEAMTTNETSFMRDMTPFNNFRDIVFPKLLEARAASRKIRIWSAACSTGQEAYSLAMMLLDMQAKWAGWTIDIVGTDLSREVVEKARAGLYSQFEVQRGLPITMLVKYFDKSTASTPGVDRWQLKDNVRKMASFSELNLLNDFNTQLGAQRGQFDVIFCRNVLIYFDPPTKTKVFDSLAAMTPADGFLFLGGAETTLGMTERFKPMDGQRGLYVRA